MSSAFSLTFAVAGVSIFAALTAVAQPKVLTLEQLLSDIENVNLSVLVTREGILQAQERERLARAPLRPRLDFNTSQQRSRRSVTGGAGDESPGGQARITNSFQSGVGASLTLLDFAQYESLRAAKMAVSVSHHDYEDAVQSVMASVAGLYFAHLRNLAFDTVIDSNMERARVLLELARNQFEAGVATQIDVTRAEAELVVQEQAKLEQGTAIVASALRIKQLLNLDLGTDIVLEEFRARQDLEAHIRQMPLELVLEQRPDFRAAAAALEQARIESRAARRERLPTVGVSGQAGVETDVIFDGDEEKFWSAGVQLNLPVFDGSRIRANEQIAASRVRQEEFRLIDLRNQIDSELRIVLQDVESQIAQIAVAEKNRALAEEELRLARVRYEQGVADNRELIDAENRFTQASFNLVNATFNYQLARVELARARGDVRLILEERDPGS